MLVVAVAVIGGLALALGLASRALRDLPVSEPLLALAVGVLVGPQVLGWLQVDVGVPEAVLLPAAQLVLAVSLMAVALRFPTRDVLAQAWPIVLLVTVVLPVMAAVAGALGPLILGLPAAGAAVLGAVLAPTDPVLSSSVVSGEPAVRSIPRRVRLLLTVESGANDGLAVVLVGLASAAALTTGLGGMAARLAGALAIAVVVGGVLGWAAGRLLLVSERHNDIEHAAFLVLTVALAFLVLGVTELLGGEALIAVFVAGLVYNHEIVESERREEWEVQEAINNFLTLPVFVLLGAMLPWQGWLALSWAGVAFAVGVLVLRRVPWLLAVRPLLSVSRPEAGFLGWFGPIGVAALYYLMQGRIDGVVDDQLWAVGALVIALSTLVHGVTATPGRRLLARVEQTAT